VGRSPRRGLVRVDAERGGVCSGRDLARGASRERDRDSTARDSPSRLARDTLSLTFVTGAPRRFSARPPVSPGSRRRFSRAGTSVEAHATLVTRAVRRRPGPRAGRDLPTTETEQDPSAASGLLAVRVVGSRGGVGSTETTGVPTTQTTRWVTTSSDVMGRTVPGGTERGRRSRERSERDVGELRSLERQQVAGVFVREPNEGLSERASDSAVGSLRPTARGSFTPPVVETPRAFTPRCPRPTCVTSHRPPHQRFHRPTRLTRWRLAVRRRRSSSC
jgi:hypothetical protein